MWDQYQTEGATFSAGDEPAADGWAQEADLARQAEHFRRWNAASIARTQGFLGPESEIPILDEHDEEDALLCEMMDNVRSKPGPLDVQHWFAEFLFQFRIK
jgi:hypothetical protein